MSLHPTKSQKNKKSKVTCDMFCSRTWIEAGELKLKDEKYNSPDMSKGSGKHSTSRFPEVVDFPRCKCGEDANRSTFCQTQR